MSIKTFSTHVVVKKCHVVSEPGLFTHEKIHRRGLAEEHGGWRDADGKWVVGNGVGAQGEGHDGMRGEIRGEGAWLRNTEDGETRMGDWWTGGRWSDVEGGTWLKESWGAKKCDGNGWWGMGSVRRVKGMMGCGVKYGVKGLG